MKDEKRLVQLNSNRMKRAETYRTLWAIDAQPGTTKEDLLKTDYWSHVASFLEPLHRLEVRADDSSFLAEYIVISCERTWAKVKLLHWFDLVDVAETDDELSEFKYKFRGPHCKHSVIRVSDDKVMIEKLATKDDALAWIGSNQNKQAA